MQIVGGGGAEGGGARRARSAPAHRRGAGRGRRSAREDAAAVQAGRRADRSPAAASTSRGSTSTTSSAALLFLLDGGSGTYNLTAPEPVTNKELSKALGRVLRRPAVAPVPALALRALYGEMARIVTTGVRAVPKRLVEEGYPFTAARPRRRPPGSGQLSPRVAALLGALTIAFSAILVKASDVAPPTSAFFRCFYAVPVLWLLARAKARTAASGRLAYARGRPLRDRSRRLALLDRVHRRRARHRARQPPGRPGRR